jgi:hypothetical protein
LKVEPFGDLTLRQVSKSEWAPTDHIVKDWKKIGGFARDVPFTIAFSQSDGRREMDDEAESRDGRSAQIREAVREVVKSFEVWEVEGKPGNFCLFVPGPLARWDNAWRCSGIWS